MKNDLKNEIFNQYIMYALQYIKSGITFCIYFTLLSLNSKIVLGLDFGLDFVSRLKSEKMNKGSLLCVTRGPCPVIPGTHYFKEGQN